MELMKVETAQLKTILTMIRQAGRVTEAKLIFSKDGLRTRVLDPSHVAMLDIQIAAKHFFEYKKQKKEIEIGVEVEKLLLALKVIKATMLSFRYERKDHSIEIIAGKTKIKLPTVDSEFLQDIRIPKVEFPGSGTIQASELKEAMAVVDFVSDLVGLELSKTGLIIDGKGDKETAETVIPDTEISDLTLKLDNGATSFRSTFDIEFLNAMTRLIPESTQFHMGNNLPIRLEFPIGEHGTGVFFLAPRVEDDD